MNESVMKIVTYVEIALETYRRHIANHCNFFFCIITKITFRLMEAESFAQIAFTKERDFASQRILRSISLPKVPLRLIATKSFNMNR